MLFNVQDLFVNLAYPVKAHHLQELSEDQWQLLGKANVALKPLSKLRDLAQIILEEKPDVVALCEVGGKESLKNFASLFLAKAYTPLLVAGNDKRGIHNGYLVRKDLPVKPKLKSHKSWPTPFRYAHELDPVGLRVTAEMAKALDIGLPAARKASRDFPTLALHNTEGRLLLTILLAHLKSAHDPYGIDPHGTMRRAAELQALVAIYQTLCKNTEAPVVVCGDFNGNASRRNTSPEFLPLYDDTDLEDVLYLSGHAEEERVTHITYYQGERSAKQLDYIFVPPSLAQAIRPDSAHVHRFRFEGGTQKLTPSSMTERWRLPSDHYPVVCQLQLT